MIKDCEVRPKSRCIQTMFWITLCYVEFSVKFGE